MYPPPSDVSPVSIMTPGQTLNQVTCSCLLTYTTPYLQLPLPEASPVSIMTLGQVLNQLVSVFKNYGCLLAEEAGVTKLGLRFHHLYMILCMLLQTNTQCVTLVMPVLFICTDNPISKDSRWCFGISPSKFKIKHKISIDLHPFNSFRHYILIFGHTHSNISCVQKKKEKKKLAEVTIHTDHAVTNNLAK